MIHGYINSIDIVQLNRKMLPYWFMCVSSCGVFCVKERKCSGKKERV